MEDELFDADRRMDEHPSRTQYSLSEMWEVLYVAHFLIHLKYLQDTNLRFLVSEEQCLRIA
jgi:hypothetical protein